MAQTDAQLDPLEEDSHGGGTDSIVLWTEFRFRQFMAKVDQIAKIQQISPASLAYIGDAVYELYIRTHYLLPPRRICDYHNQVVAHVRAESQAKILRSLEPYLTASEKDVLRRGRNAATKTPRRLNREIYQQASSLETLLGYLYLTDTQRLTQLLAHLQLDTP
ncbi:ribonuclease III domain-containing protein [Moorena sp. SIO3B2]|uniref:Mini-ribonuclease 3 n=1 Tax=Moorena sp. SIO3B2 TaxID=2607827 RepID=UPI0013CCA962|nr:ribonuclease III domain-containing protein [Moorena sp. SIO3B2]NEP35553.1 Mini-ribonuclease 3 [Moorena sp. SIO3B2]